MASRFARVATSRTCNQFPRADSFRIIVGPFREFRITTSISPSLSKSSNAAPRALRLTSGPSPDLSDTLTNRIAEGGRDAAPPASATSRQRTDAGPDKSGSLPPSAIRFVNVSDKSGDGPLVKRSARGAAFDDLDNDGDIDVVILNSRKVPTIMRNESVRGNWLQVRLAGTRANRDAIGARVKVFAGDLTLVDEVHSGRGYQSDYGRRLHFGLGKRDKIDRVEVHWPGGRTYAVAQPKLNAVLTVTEAE